MPNYTNKKPVMVDLDTYIAAGINPKTGLPLKCEQGRGLEYDIKPEIKKTLRIMDQQNAINRFVWHNLPSGLNGQLLEKILYYRGQGAFFYMPTDEKFYFLPYALNGSIDCYARFTSITPLPFGNGATQTNENGKVKPWINGLTRKPHYEALSLDELTLEDFDEGCVLLNDYTPQISQTVIPRADLQEVYINMMSDILPFARTALLNGTGITAIRVGSEDEQSNVDAASRSINKAALMGQKFIPIVGKLDFQNLTNNSLVRAEEFLLTLQSIDNLRMSLYGINSAGLFQKKAHMLQSEADMNNTNVGLIMQDSFTNRQRFCDIVNSIWGLGIRCEVSETISHVDRNGDYELSDKQDQSGAQPGEQPEVNETEEEDI